MRENRGGVALSIATPHFLPTPFFFALISLIFQESIFRPIYAAIHHLCLALQSIWNSRIVHITQRVLFLFFFYVATKRHTLPPHTYNTKHDENFYGWAPDLQSPSLYRKYIWKIYWNVMDYGIRYTSCPFAALWHTSFHTHVDIRERERVRKTKLFYFQRGNILVVVVVCSIHGMDFLFFLSFLPCEFILYFCKSSCASMGEDYS